MWAVLELDKLFAIRTRSLLHIAVDLGDKSDLGREMRKTLLTHPRFTNYEARDGLNRTALQRAIAQHACLDLFEADSVALTKLDYSVRHKTKREQREKGTTGATLLHQAAERGLAEHIDAIMSLPEAVYPTALVNALWTFPGDRVVPNEAADSPDEDLLRSGRWVVAGARTASYGSLCWDTSSYLVVSTIIFTGCAICAVVIFFLS